MRKFLVLLFLTGALFVGLRLGVAWFFTAQRNQCLSQCRPLPIITQGAEPTAEYYTILRNNCCNTMALGNKECFDSVDAMEKTKAILFPNRESCIVNHKSVSDGDKCPAGMKEGFIKQDNASFLWCEKE